METTGKGDFASHLTGTSEVFDTGLLLLRIYPKTSFSASCRYSGGFWREEREPRRRMEIEYDAMAKKESMGRRRYGLAFEMSTDFCLFLLCTCVYVCTFWFL